MRVVGHIWGAIKYDMTISLLDLVSSCSGKYGTLVNLAMVYIYRYGQKAWASLINSDNMKPFFSHHFFLLLG